MDLQNYPDEMSTGRIGPTAPIGSDQKMSPPSQAFQSFMQGQANPLSQPPSPLGSPFDLAQQHTLAATPTMGSLLTQVTAAQSTLGDLSNQLTTPNLKLKQSSKYLLKNKLSDANGNLFSAASKLGIEPPKENTVLSGPFGKFIGMITDGQKQLHDAQEQLQSLKDKGEQLNPGDMLLIQVKLNLAQQQLQYSSIILSKAVDDLKMMFNVQL